MHTDTGILTPGFYFEDLKTAYNFTQAHWRLMKQKPGYVTQPEFHLWLEIWPLQLVTFPVKVNILFTTIHLSSCLAHHTFLTLSSLFHRRGEAWKLIFI